MTLLPAVVLCAGRRGFRTGDDLCPQRRVCQRFLGIADSACAGPAREVYMWLCRTPALEQRIQPEAA